MGRAPVVRQNKSRTVSSPYANPSPIPRYCPTPEVTQQWLLQESRKHLEPKRRRLEEEFSDNPWPTTLCMTILAWRLSLPHYTVYEWFGLRRAKEVDQAAPVHTAPDPSVFPTYRSWREYVAIYGTERYRAKAREALQNPNQPIWEPPDWRTMYEPQRPSFRPGGRWSKPRPEECAQTYLYTPPRALPRSFQLCDPHPVSQPKLSGNGLSVTGNGRQATLPPGKQRYSPLHLDYSCLVRPSWGEDTTLSAPTVDKQRDGKPPEDNSSSGSSDSDSDSD